VAEAAPGHPERLDVIVDHFAQPGPVYWDYRCTVCDEPVSNHGRLKYLIFRVFRYGRSKEVS